MSEDPQPLTAPTEADPFDLPEWLATSDVVWTAEGSSRGRPYVVGALQPRGTEDDRNVPCDLLAVDRAHPRPLLPEAWRARAHADWARGEVLLLNAGDDRLVLAAPGYLFDADLVLEALARLARAVGVQQQSFRALLRP